MAQFAGFFKVNLLDLIYVVEIEKTHEKGLFLVYSLNDLKMVYQNEVDLGSEGYDGVWMYG